MEKKSWISKSEYELTRDNLELLFNNLIPAIRVKKFANLKECNSFINAIRWAEENDIMKYYSVKPKVGYIGTAQVEFRWGHKKSNYFEAVKQAWSDWEKVVNKSWNPLDKFIQLLSNITGHDARIAQETEYGNLFAGIIRKASNGIGRHVDFAPMNSPDYDISQINSQLGWNLFVDAPSQGGITTIYNRPWNVNVIKGQEPPMSYGLSDDHILGAEKFSYKSNSGDIVIFNSRNPHEVSSGNPDDSDRLQIGSFIGRLPNNNMVLWS